MTQMRIFGLAESSTVNGPGRRAVIWTQGCSLACKGCWNPESWDPQVGREMTALEIVHWLAKLYVHGDIDGVTLSGGEPMAQADAVLELVTLIRKSLNNFSVGMFSGHSEKELDRGQYKMFTGIHGAAIQAYGWRLIKSHLDFAVLGRYNAQLPSSAPLTTSSNQKLVLFSERYKLSDFAPQAVEISIEPDGLTVISGFPVRGSI